MSNVTEFRAAEYHHLCHALRWIQFQPCSDPDRIFLDIIKYWVMICAEYFHVGLQFLIPSFILEVVDYHTIALNQFPPNSISYLIAFITKCRMIGIEPDIDVFHYFFLPG